jgi:hypothetical protein
MANRATVDRQALSPDTASHQPPNPVMDNRQVRRPVTANLATANRQVRRLATGNLATGNLATGNLATDSPAMANLGTRRSASRLDTDRPERPTDPRHTARPTGMATEPARRDPRGLGR